MADNTQMEQTGTATKCIVHFGPEDIHSDNRVLKELDSLSHNSNYEVHGAGIYQEGFIHRTNLERNFSIVTMFIVTEKLFAWAPRPIRYTLKMAELTMRYAWFGARKRPDVVHCHDAITLPAGAVVKLITGAKLIYDAHELESAKAGQSRLLSSATLFIERFLWRFVDHVITVSPAIINWYNENLGTKPSSLVLNSPMILTRDKSVDKKTKAPHGYFHELYAITRDRLVFLYVGALSTGRGIDVMLRAFLSAEVKSHLVFLGYGNMNDKIAANASEHDKIHLHSPVPHEQVVDLSRNADVGLCLIENVSLSDYYCLPNKLFEYAFAGLPVLASRFPEIERVVQQYKLGYCCDIDEKSLVDAILECERDKPQRIDADLSSLSWESQEKVLANAYSTVLAIGS